MASCHTAELDGYIVEGHVPAQAVAQLLKERPKAIGLAAPGMPAARPAWRWASRKSTRCICSTRRVRANSANGWATSRPEPASPARRAAGQDSGPRPGRGKPRGEGRLQQIAAGRRVEVEHLARDEDARQFLQHQIVVDLVEGDAAGGRDGALEPGDAGDLQRRILDERRHALRRRAAGPPAAPRAAARSRPSRSPALRRKVACDCFGGAARQLARRDRRDGVGPQIDDAASSRRRAATASRSREESA